MTFHRISSPLAGVARSRIGHLLGCAVTALCVGGLAPAAYAQDECGVAVGGNVTCPASATNYPGGITYNAAADISVNAPAGVTVATSTPATNGITVTSPGASTLTGGATVSTTGDGSYGVVLTSGTGPASLTVGNVTTAGALSTGIIATGGLDQDVSVTAGNVATTGTAASAYFFLPSSTAVKATAAGIGNLSIATGTIATAAGGAAGINALADVGNVSVTTGAITTSGDGSNAISAQSNSGNVAVSVTGTIAAAGMQSNGIYATALNGAASVQVQDVNIAGTYNNSGVIAEAGAGGATIQAGNVAVGGTFSTGLEALSTGGNASIAANNITATGVANVAGYAASDVGNATITTTGNVVVSGRGSFGLIANAGTGNASITANNVSTVAANADDTLTNGNAVLATGGTATVVVTGTAATTGTAEYNGRPYSGNAVTAIASSGNAGITVQNASAAGAGTNAIAASAVGGDANVTVTGNVSTSGANGDAVSAISTTGAANVINNGQITATGSGSRGIYASGQTAVNITNAGTLSGATYALSTTGGPATVGNTGTINGAIALAGGEDVVNNYGTFNATGTSSFAEGDSFNNAGVVAIAAPGGVPAAVTFAGLASFNNAGTIDLRNGVVGDNLTLAGNYFGSGNAVLGIDVAPGAAIASDRLVIGGAATGSTAVQVALAPGAQPLFSTGTTIVQAGPGSSSTAFGITPGTQDFGLVGYGVVYNPANFTYALTAAPDDAAHNLLGYATAERNLWIKSADAVSAELQSKRDALWNLGGTPPSGKFWVTMAASYKNTRGYRDFGNPGQTHLTDTGYRQDFFGGQLGLDLSGGLFNRGGFAVGVTGGYLNSKVKLGSGLDRIDFDAVNGGAYLSFTSGNIFANALGKYDYYWARPDSRSAGFNQHLHGHSYGGRGELGIRLGGDALFVEPLAQISWLRTSLNGFAVQGTSVDFQDRNALKGKAGGRIGGNITLSPDTKMAFYAGGSYVHDFYGYSQLSLANLGGNFTIAGQTARDAGEALLGVNIASAHGITGFIEGTYTRSFGSGDNGALTERGAGGRAGIRVQF